MTVLLVPDTNIWLHFRPLDEINWVAELGDATIIFAMPPLIRELDHLKNNPRTRDRARRTPDASIVLDSP